MCDFSEADVCVFMCLYSVQVHVYVYLSMCVCAGQRSTSGVAEEPALCDRASH